MEVNKLLKTFASILLLASCSNTSELETGEIETLQLLIKTFNQSNNSKVFIDSKKLLNREQIDTFAIPILFVELESGQNGTLTLYPGQGIGQTWLGADGATITLQRGVVKASRGMGNDLMGSSSSMPQWSKIKNKQQIYSRKLIYITGNNNIYNRIFKCDIQKANRGSIVEIWDVKFPVMEFKEFCASGNFKIENTYYLDSQNIVRKSKQFHSDTIGYIVTERLDR